MTGAGSKGSTAVPNAALGRRPGSLWRWIAVSAVALVVLLGGYGVYVFSATSSPGTTLTIYTYSSLLGGGCGANASNALAPFAHAYGVTLRIECPQGTLASTLIQQKNAPGADLVIGLDEITATQADQNGTLIPYAPPALAEVSPQLVDEISPDHAVTPYEWGYLGIDVCAPFANATGGLADHLDFPEIAANTSWSRQLLVEDPATDITGEEFLAWEIEYYTQVLHEPWTGFWSAVAPHMTTAPSWDDADAEFTCASGSPQLFASYLNDPAYAADSGSAGLYNSSASWWNGTAYGWKTIYGVGIVRGTHHLSLDEAFVNWFLGGSLQAELPTTEWEFPANQTVAVPAVFHWAMNSSLVRPLNDAIPPAQVVGQLTGWLEEWQRTVNAAG
jgi:ABC-type thiamine transport system substrate-binding protein